MKSVVVSIKGKHAALLRDDGSMVKVKNNQYCIGDTVDDSIASTSNRFLKVASIAATLVLVFGSSLTWAYYTPAYYVSLDSVEDDLGIVLTVNRFEKVISVQGVAEDTVKVVHLEVDQAIENLSQQKEVLTTVSSKNAEKSAEVVEALKTENEIIADEVDIEMLQKAKAIGITPGKYNIIVNKLDEAPEEYVDVPIKEIMEKVKEKEKEKEKEEEVDQDQDNEADNGKKDDKNEKNDKSDKDNNGNNGNGKGRR